VVLLEYQAYELEKAEHTSYLGKSGRDLVWVSLVNVDLFRYLYHPIEAASTWDFFKIHINTFY